MTALTAGAPVALSRDFTLAELLRTATGIPNEPTEDRQLASLVLLATRILQPIRDEFGPTRITSGFRSPAVNAAVGGSDDSDHLRGGAADLIPLNAPVRDVFRWIVRHRGLPVGQVIWEHPRGKAWIHVSLRREGRERQALVFNGQAYEAWKEGWV